MRAQTFVAARACMSGRMVRTGEDWKDGTRTLQRQEPVTANVEYADIKVTFHPRKLPKTVWEAQWADVTSEPVSGNVIPLDDYRTATARLAS